MSTKSKRQKKTEALTLRLDPRMKFQIELLSRIWHQSITGVIETAVERAASVVKVSADRELTITQLTRDVWSPDDAETLIRLAIQAPHLMSFEESCIWAVIEASEEDCFFRYWYNEKGKLISVRPRKKVIKMAWELLLSRAEEMKKFGRAERIGYAELADHIDDDPINVKESAVVKPWETGYDSEPWLIRWSSMEEKSLLDELGADRPEGD